MIIVSCRMEELWEAKQELLVRRASKNNMDLTGVLVVVQFGSLAHVPIVIGINRGLSFKIFKLTHYRGSHNTNETNFINMDIDFKWISICLYL